MPRLWESEMEAPRAARKIERATNTVKGADHLHVGNIKKVIDASIVEQPTVLKTWFARRMATLELDRHRRRGASPLRDGVPRVPARRAARTRTSPSASS